MPTPCEHCGDWFDLNDGCGSEKWHKGIVICETCAQSEQEEIESDEEIQEQVERAENAMFDFNESVKYLKEKKALDKLTPEARALMVDSEAEYDPDAESGATWAEIGILTEDDLADL